MEDRRPSGVGPAGAGVKRDVVSQWRKRFFEQRMTGLEDRPRRGRPPTFPPSGTR